MGGQHRNRHPPVGQDKPEAFRVVVRDTYIQHMLRNAALVIRNGSDVPEFLMFCASYVLTRHRSLTNLRRIYRKGKRDIQAAVDAVPGSKLDPYPDLEARQRREREQAFDRFARWAEKELHEDITGEKR